MAQHPSPGDSRARLSATLHHAKALADLLTGFHVLAQRTPGYYVLGPDTARHVTETVTRGLETALASLGGSPEGGAGPGGNARVVRDLEIATEAINRAIGALGGQPGPASLYDLQFIQDPDEAGGHWSVTPSGNPARDFAEGAAFGNQFVAYLQRSREPGTPAKERQTAADALGRIMEAMTRHPDTAQHIRGFGRALTRAVGRGLGGG